MERKLSWEEGRPPPALQRAFHRFERELQRNFTLDYSDVKRVERLMGALDSEIVSAAKKESDSTSDDDQPPTLRRNRIRLPVVPRAYATAGERVEPMTSAQIKFGHNQYIKTQKLWVIFSSTNHS